MWLSDTIERFMGWLGDRYRRAPAKTFLACFFLVMAVDAVPEAARDRRRPVGVWFEAFFANSLYWGGLALAVLAVFLGFWAYRKFNSRLLGWLVGLVAMGGVVVFDLAASDIPGVGWRFGMMLRSD